jgi:predicted transcriptional regulator
MTGLRTTLHRLLAQKVITSGLTLDAIAKQTGFTVAYIDRLINGNGDFSVSSIDRFLEKMRWLIEMQITDDLVPPSDYEDILTGQAIVWDVYEE